MAIDWDAIAIKSQKATDEHFGNQISSLTKLTNDQVVDLISNSGISKQDLVEVLRIVDDATNSNEAKAKAISEINKGVDVLVAVGSKFLL